MMKIAYIGTYPPRACGIGTFTQNLIRGVFANDENAVFENHAQVIAMVDGQEPYDFPPEVSMTIEDLQQEQYLAAARYLNESDADVVVLQHEYGIFGGQDGAYILTLLDALQKPLVVTFHTILKDPSNSQKYILQQIAAKARKVVVMSRLARRFLMEIYQLPASLIQIIEHGAPSLKLGNRDALRKKLDFEGRKIMFTFGLIGRGKGLETAIEALPAIVAQHPDIQYVVLGKTHPGVLRHCGEEYREYLLELAAQNGVADNVRFINAFAEEQDLWEYLQACDVYVTPYLNEAQITSGTLSYAVGAGAAVVSTPYWHAKELLENGRGRLFDFRNPVQLAEIVNELFNEKNAWNDLRSNALAYGKNLNWNLTGRQYYQLFDQVISNKKLRNNGHATAPALPDVNFMHLRTLTDDTGILQHAKFAIPNRYEGYCLDDNARAMIVALTGYHNYPKKWLKRAISTYMGYIYHCQREDGKFRNFMSYERNYLEEQGSEDSFGRAVWSLGVATAYATDGSTQALAKEIFWKALPHFNGLTSLRAMAYTIAGLYHFLKKHPGDEGLLNQMHLLRRKLCDHFHSHKTEGWQWFEPYMTYCNGVLPLALFYSLEMMPGQDEEAVALAATAFLEEHTMPFSVCRPIGCDNFFQKNSERSLFDQQPVDVMMNVLLFLQAHKVTGNDAHLKNALACYEWFHGKNDLHLPLYDAETGGCCDGLMATGVNANQGAESTISYLLSHLSVEAALQAQNKDSVPAASELKPVKLLKNGQKKALSAVANL